jgi:SAM-dependent methyltransferase
MLDPQQARDVLARNTGFDEPGRWVGYARRHDFKPIRAEPVPRCPDCSAIPKPRAWGQYIHYSTLIHLRECEYCGLVWADARIDPRIIRQHFEQTYKDDRYFRVSRKPIFEWTAQAVDEVAPLGAHVLDIGGARGDLMDRVVTRRSDIDATVHDVSATATRLAAERFGFATITGDASTLASHRARYDVVVLSDVLYYEPKLPTLWSALARLIRPGGAIVLRVPNKALLTRVGQAAFALTHDRAARRLQDRVPFHNPEHIFVFRPRYLRARLASIGFDDVRFIPSPLLSSAKRAGRALFGVARAVQGVTGRDRVLTPSMLVVGTGRAVVGGEVHTEPRSASRQVEGARTRRA